MEVLQILATFNVIIIGINIGIAIARGLNCMGWLCAILGWLIIAMG